MSMIAELSNSWRRGFEVAASASNHSTGPRLGMKLGAALYSGSSLISIGFNNWFRTHPESRNTSKDFDKNIHAEHSALLKRRHYTNSKNLTMYVYRSKINCNDKKFELACSKPCPNCMALLKYAGVRRVRFIDELGRAAEMKL
jgi:deoxycytidylate deaminase